MLLFLQALEFNEPNTRKIVQGEAGARPRRAGPRGDVFVFGFRWLQSRSPSAGSGPARKPRPRTLQFGSEENQVVVVRPADAHSTPTRREKKGMYEDRGVGLGDEIRFSFSDQQFE